MSLTKTIDGMSYEATPVNKKKVSDPKRALIKEAEQLNTLSLIWLVIKRHRVGLLLIGNIILILNWIMPAWFSLLLSLFGR